MKILHTSDWHLGHLLYGYERTEEQESMLQQMVEIVRQQQPDVFLLCGDVYHTPQPSAAVQTLFAEYMVKIHNANPSMTIVITAGNHDSGSRHEVFQTPWKALNVHTIGLLDKDNLAGHIIEVPDKGFVVAVPYTYERNIPEEFFQQLLDEVAEKNAEGLPVVLSAHTTVQGCDFTGHDHASEYSAGGIDALNIEQLGAGYDYLALGHIHRGQFVHTGKHNVRYSGTPIPVSFDENFDHTASIVEIAKHGDSPAVTQIEIDNPHPLVTLPADGSFVLWDEAKQLLDQYDKNIPSYIRLNVEVEDFLPVDAYAEAKKLTENKNCCFCHINAKRNGLRKVEEKALSIQELQSEEPIDLAKRYADDLCIPFDDELTEVFNEVQRLVNEDLSK